MTSSNQIQISRMGLYGFKFGKGLVEKSAVWIMMCSFNEITWKLGRVKLVKTSSLLGRDIVLATYALVYVRLQ